MGKLEDQVNELYEKYQQDIPVVHGSIGTQQQEIPVIHKSAKTGQQEIPVIHQSAVKGQQEIPVIHRLLTNLPLLIDKERAFLFCYVNANIQYHLDIAEAEKKLATALRQCSRLIAPPRPPRKPVRRVRPKR